jgi:hypothetical protein
LAILAVLLYTPSDLDKTSSLEGIFVQILDNTLFLIVEDEVVGKESLDNHFTRWISVMINFILSGLGIFAQARSDVATKSHNVKKEVTDLILPFAGCGRLMQLGKIFVVERSTLPRDIHFP